MIYRVLIAALLTAALSVIGLSGHDLPRFKIEHALAQGGPVPGLGAFPVSSTGALPLTVTQMAAFTTDSLGYPTQTFTTTAPTGTGDLLVYCTEDTSEANVISISDGLNTFTSDGNVQGQWANSFTSPIYNKLWISYNSTAVPSGTTVTMTYQDGPFASTWSRVMGLDIASSYVKIGIDRANTASSTSGSSQATAATGTLAQASQLAIGCGGQAGSSALPYLGASGFTKVASEGSTQTLNMGMDYKITAATTAVSYAPRWTAATNTWAGVQTFPLVSSDTIGTPVSLGSNTASTSGAGGTNLFLSAINIAVNDYEFGGVYGGASSGFGAFFADQFADNSFSAIIQSFNSSGTPGGVGLNTNHISTAVNGATPWGDFATANIPDIATGGFRIAFPSGLYSQFGDKKAGTPNAAGNGTSVSLTTNPLTYPNAIVVGALFVSGQTSITEAPGFTSIVNGTIGPYYFDLAYQIVGSTSAVTYNPSWATTGQYSAAVSVTW